VAGLFETLRVRKGQIPFLREHVARFATSLAALGMAPPVAGVEERLRRHGGHGDLVVRLTLDERGERIETRPLPAERPMRVVLSDVPHQPYPHKVTAREVFDSARERVVPNRADEVLLFTREGLLAEGSITSAFVWMDETLCTPPLELGILPGVGRARLIAVARARGIGVREERLSRGQVAGLPLLLVNAVRGVVEAGIQGAPRPPADDRTLRLAGAFWG